MTRHPRARLALFGCIGVFGVGLYLWPALTAPVVLWSDSETDLAWARAGLGILQPAGTIDHSAKPGYLLFLRMALALGGGTPRGVVVVQSLLLVAAILIAAVFLGRRRGLAFGIAVFLAEILFLRPRDAASSIMSESLAAAVFLLIAVRLVEPPRKTAGLLALGIAIGALFLVRPNVGGIAACLGVARLSLDRRWRGLLVSAAAAAVVVLPLWIATSGGSHGAPRSLGYQMLEASADDFWIPSLGPIERDAEARELTRTWRQKVISNWRATLGRGSPDATRQIIWRAAHGLLGTEFYDARWSPVYRSVTTALRLLSPFLILAASSLILVIPVRGDALRVKALGLLLLALILAQSLVIGSLPRYVLPLLPGLLLFGLCAVPSLRAAGGWRLFAAAAVFALTLVALHRQRGVLAWEWGQIESAGVLIEQGLPRASLPRRAPATLHIRIAAPVAPTAAGLQIETADGQLLYSSSQDQLRERPELTIALPQALLDHNQRSALLLRLRAFGDYDASHYLLFPVVPPPWSTPARRTASPELSPPTGLVSGALDWWAHEGTP